MARSIGGSSARKRPQDVSQTIGRRRPASAYCVVNIRALETHYQGTLQMNSRADEVADFIAQNSWSEAQKAPLAGDASARRYERLTMRDSKTAVLMDAPPEAGQQTEPFVAIAKHLNTLGLSAPEIYAANSERGFLLIEDLGDDLFAHMVLKKNEKK
mmetsp:Transcript_16044/g.24938  ORF Transcript_16044/g.24938 Transcript_16044/m.24938 type:complete len:157 (-) Transcript_16044:71-541(-)